MYNIKVTWRVRFIWIWFDEKSQIKNSNGSDDWCCAPYRSDGGRHWRVWDQWGLRQPGDLQHRFFLKKNKKKTTNRRFTLLMWGECLFVCFLYLPISPCCSGSVLRGKVGDPTGEGEPQRRRHRPGSPAGLHRRPPGGDAAQRAPAPRQEVSDLGRPHFLFGWGLRPGLQDPIWWPIFISMELLAKWIAS